MRLSSQSRPTPKAWELGMGKPPAGKADWEFRERAGRVSVRHRMKLVSSVLGAEPLRESEMLEEKGKEVSKKGLLA